ERVAERERLDELRRTLSPVERAARGHALLDLEAVDESYGLGGRVQVAFEPADRTPLAGRVDARDVVELKPRKGDGDEPARGVVARRSRPRITIAFDRPPPPFVFDGRLLVDLLPNDVTWARARSALAAVRSGLSSSGGPDRRRFEVLVGLEPPRF